LRLFESGALSSDPTDPLRADALERVDAARLAEAFQASDDNPLVAWRGGVTAAPSGRGGGRPGDLFDRMAARARAAGCRRR